MTIDHTCPTVFAVERGLRSDSPLDASWCLTTWRDWILESEDPEILSPELRLWKEGTLSTAYVPFDWVNTSAKLMIVGITPGRYQCNEALREAKRSLEAGLSNEEVLRNADSVGSFSGPMRTNLVEMLNGIGVAAALEIDDASHLFDSRRDLVANASAIDFPIFVDGRNYTGSNPSLLRHATLRSMVVACLGSRVLMVPDTVIIPLGKSARSAVELLIEMEMVERARCLLDFPHPSGANGWRVRHYQARRAHLSAQVTTAFA